MIFRGSKLTSCSRQVHPVTKIYNCVVTYDTIAKSAFDMSAIPIEVEYLLEVVYLEKRYL